VWVVPVLQPEGVEVIHTVDIPESWNDALEVAYMMRRGRPVLHSVEGLARYLGALGALVRADGVRA
jgi:hypothetical protein